MACASNKYNNHSKKIFSSTSLEEGEVQICKVFIIGQFGVGKTSIVSRFIKDIFEENLINEAEASYAGKTMTFKEYENKRIKFEIWDIEGQEKFRTLANLFNKNLYAAILVYDTTNKESFEEIQEIWINELEKYAPKNSSK